MRKFLLSLIFIWLNTNCIFSSSPFRCIVALDGSGTHSSLQSAIDECPDNERSLIFIKNGIYEEKISIGEEKVASDKIISLIGESVEGVIIISDDMITSENGFRWTDVVTAQIYCKDFYAENITFQNAAGIGGQALAFHNGADRQTLKNCRLLGYQDTHRSKKGVRAYLKDCVVEGTVDFIYAGGVIFFDDCNINCVKGGGYIVAPEDPITTISGAQTASGLPIRVGFFLRDCIITADEDVEDNTYYLGRPWKTQCGAYYLNCKMGNHIKPVGWNEWNGNEKTASFGEYKSRDLEGNLLDISQRVDWSLQLHESDVEDFMTPEYIYRYVNANEPYNPISICSNPSQPYTLECEGRILSWEAVEGVAGYLLYKDGRFMEATTLTTYTDLEEEEGEYSIVTMKETGTLSDPLKVGEIGNISSIERKENLQELELYITDRTIEWQGEAEIKLYNLSGGVVAQGKGDKLQVEANIPGGLYLLQLIQEKKIVRKIMIK